MSQTRKLLGVAILAMSVSTTLTACGETKGERAISGGAAGAATAAFTDKDDIDLGEEVIDLQDED